MGNSDAITTTATSRYSFEMLGRAVSLMEHVAAAADPVGVSALARRTGMPKSSAFRLLTTLTALDMVDHTPNGYRPGPALRHLAGLLHEHLPFDLRRLAMPYLIELYERTGDAVTLGVLDHAEMVVLESIRNHRHSALAERPERSPAHSSAIGKLLLARDAAAPARAAPTGALDTRAGRAGEQRALSAEFARIRQTGIAFSGQQHPPGIHEVALPVLDRDGPVAAVARSRPAGVAFDVAGDVLHRQIALAISTAVRQHASVRTDPTRPRPLHPTADR